MSETDDFKYIPLTVAEVTADLHRKFAAVPELRYRSVPLEQFEKEDLIRIIAVQVEREERRFANSVPNWLGDQRV